MLRLQSRNSGGSRIDSYVSTSWFRAKDLRMTSKSIHRAITLGFREKPNLRPVIGFRPDVYLHSATKKEGGFRGEKTESFAFIV